MTLQKDSDSGAIYGYVATTTKKSRIRQSKKAGTVREKQTSVTS